MCKVDRVLDDVDLVFQRRGDVDRRVGDDQRFLVRRHVHDEAMADAARGAQPAFAADDGGHQFVGVQAALHQQLAFGFANELHGLGRGRFAVRCVDNLVIFQIDAVLTSDRLNFCRRADQNRRNDAKFRRLDSATQRGFIAWMHDHGDRRSCFLCSRYQTIIFGTRRGAGCADRRDRVDVVTHGISQESVVRSANRPEYPYCHLGPRETGPH